MKYRLLIDYEVIEFLETLPRKDQRLLRNRFVSTWPIRVGMLIVMNRCNSNSQCHFF